MCLSHVIGYCSSKLVEEITLLLFPACLELTIVRKGCSATAFRCFAENRQNVVLLASVLRITQSVCYRENPSEHSRPSLNLKWKSVVNDIPWMLWEADFYCECVCWCASVCSLLLKGWSEIPAWAGFVSLKPTLAESDVECSCISTCFIQSAVRVWGLNLYSANCRLVLELF